MRTVLRVAIEYVPVVCGFFLLFHNQTIPAFVAFALWVPVNQLMRYLEVKRLRNSVEQYNRDFVRIKRQISSLKQVVNQHASDIAQISSLEQVVNQHSRDIAFLQLFEIGGDIDVISQVSNQISSLEQVVNQHSSDIASLQQFLDELSASSVDKKTQVWLETVLQQSRPEYIPLSNRHESHRVLKESLSEVRQQMILVCPWLSWRVFNNYNIYREFHRLLEQGVRIEVIYGYTEDVRSIRDAGGKVNRWTLLETVGKDAWKYDALRELTNLEQQFDQLLRLKLVGTHEKFLVQDERIAMIGSHNLLTSGPSDKREFGIQTIKLSQYVTVPTRLQNRT